MQTHSEVVVVSKKIGHTVQMEARKIRRRCPGVLIQGVPMRTWIFLYLYIYYMVHFYSNWIFTIETSSGYEDCMSNAHFHHTGTH